MAFICQFASGLNSAVGSLLRPDRLITPSTPSSAASGMSRTSRDDEFDLVANGGERIRAEVETVEHAHLIAALERRGTRTEPM